MELPTLAREGQSFWYNPCILYSVNIFFTSTENIQNYLSKNYDEEKIENAIYKKKHNSEQTVKLQEGFKEHRLFPAEKLK